MLYCRKHKKNIYAVTNIKKQPYILSQTSKKHTTLYCHKHKKQPYILSQTSKSHIMLYCRKHKKNIYTVTNIKNNHIYCHKHKKNIQRYTVTNIKNNHIYCHKHQKPMYTVTNITKTTIYTVTNTKLTRGLTLFYCTDISFMFIFCCLRAGILPLTMISALVIKQLQFKLYGHLLTLSLVNLSNEVSYTKYSSIMATI